MEVGLVILLNKFPGFRTPPELVLAEDEVFAWWSLVSRVSFDSSLVVVVVVFVLLL